MFTDGKHISVPVCEFRSTAAAQLYEVSGCSSSVSYQRDLKNSPFVASVPNNESLFPVCSCGGGTHCLGHGSYHRYNNSSHMNSMCKKNVHHSDRACMNCQLHTYRVCWNSHLYFDFNFGFF